MILAGVDECGRGCLAGPVVAAAVILPQNHRINDLADSKKLSAKKRSLLEPVIKSKALAWAIAEVDADEIDRLNILKASLLAMRIAIERLPLTPTRALFDGTFIPEAVKCEARAVVKGDALVSEISAASILAKQYRDRLMCDYDQVYPEYGFASNKGYPTKFHLHALHKHGITTIHRKSFSPVARLSEHALG